MWGAPYTPEELKQALALAETKPWKDVVRHFPGRTLSGLYQAAVKYRNGTWHPTGAHYKRVRKNALCEELVSSGVTTLKPIAERLGVTVQTAHRRLMLLGLDAEMRRDAASLAEMQKPETGVQDA